MNDRATTARGRLEGWEVQNIADCQLASEVYYAVDPAGAPNETANVIAAGPQHADHNRADETAGAGDKSLQVSQPQSFAIIV